MELVAKILKMFNWILYLPLIVVPNQSRKYFSSIALLCLSLVLDYFLILQENIFIVLIKELAQKQSLFKKMWYPPHLHLMKKKNKYVNKISIYMAFFVLLIICYFYINYGKLITMKLPQVWYQQVNQIMPS